MARFFRLIVATVALVALLAACGGTASGPGVATLEDPSASSSPGASPASAVTPQDAALAYARCMRENGVDMPDPHVTTSGNGEIMIDQQGGAPVAKDKMAAADKVCHHFMAAAGPGGPARQPSAEDMDKILAFAKCMREHGIDMPDPQMTGGGGIVIQGSSTDSGNAGGGPKGALDDPEFQAAQTACGGLLPGKPGTNSNGGPAPAGGGVVTGPASTAATK